LASLLESLAGDPHAPSAVTERRRAVDVHLADSLAALSLEPVRNAGVIADLGSGAGFPGLALAVALPNAEVRLVESIGRKGEFMARAIDAAAITNATVVVARAEEWLEGLEANDVITARALAPLSVVCEYAAPLLKLGGTFVAWTGRRDMMLEAAAELAAGELGLSSLDPVRADAYDGADQHHLHMYVKLRETPSRFPRRPGIARKRPLGGSSRA
jgi:16S rRNA (guanine527-N7)-methyltransferase